METPHMDMPSVATLGLSRPGLVRPGLERPFVECVHLEHKSNPANRSALLYEKAWQYAAFRKQVVLSSSH